MRDLKIKWFSTLGRDDNDDDDDGYLTTIVAYLFTAILENLKRVWIESMGGRFLFALFREIYNEFIKIYKWQFEWFIYFTFILYFILLLKKDLIEEARISYHV